MTSPSNCLTTILSNTSVVPLEGYFRTAERTNSDDNLNIGHKDPYVRNPKFFSEREREDRSLAALRISLLIILLLNPQ